MSIDLGLPTDVDKILEEELKKEEQKIKVRVQKRRYGKLMTIIEGIDPRDVNVKELLKMLKSKLACGGTFKDNVIELQGDHRNRIKDILIKYGFKPEQIEIE